MDTVRTLRWEFVPDDRHCGTCGKNKFQGVNFSVTSREYQGAEYYYVHNHCNHCQNFKKKLKQIRERVPVSIRITNYFLTKKYDEAYFKKYDI